MINRSRLWLKLLPWAELWYNSSYHSFLGVSPFKALYERESTEIPSYNPGDSPIQVVDIELQIREKI